jgi:hypothetical protein
MKSVEMGTPEIPDLGVQKGRFWGSPEGPRPGPGGAKLVPFFTRISKMAVWESCHKRVFVTWAQSKSPKNGSLILAA